MTRIVIIAALALVAPLTLLVHGKAAGTPVYGYTVVNSFPHDPQAFTQGLILRDGVLYESTGLNGQSSLRKVRLETGEVLQRITVDGRYFAEGMTDWGTRLIQLTYTTKIGFVYDLSTFALQRTFDYTGQGWGLTHDRRRLIMSDGTSALRFLDPDTLRETGRVTAWLDLSGIRGPVRSGTDDVLNGIAYDAARDRLFVTGKLWPRLFEIRIKR